MIAKLEKKIITDYGQTSAQKYKNLHNLLHWHTEHEIIYVSKGIVELNVNNKIYTLKDGMSAFIKSGEIHCINGTADSITHVIKSYAPTALSITKGKKLLCPVITECKSAQKKFREIETELKNKKDYSGIIADSLINCIVAEIFRTEQLSDDSPIKESLKYMDTLNWITENYNNICFEDAARYMNFSNAYFSKYFQNLTGMKFTTYLNILKVSAAIDKITEGKSSMTEISINCGFGTIRNFNRVFKMYTGYAPKSLPDDYVFVYTITQSDNIGFNPTLTCSEIVE